MKISILAVGKIKEDWLKQGIAEYRKRLSKFCEIEMIEIPDAPEGDSIDKAMAEEGHKMLARLKDQDLVIALDLKGERGRFRPVFRETDPMDGPGRCKSHVHDRRIQWVYAGSAVKGDGTDLPLRADISTSDGPSAPDGTIIPRL